MNQIFLIIMRQFPWIIKITLDHDEIIILKDDEANLLTGEENNLD